MLIAKEKKNMEEKIDDTLLHEWGFGGFEGCHRLRLDGNLASRTLKGLTG